MKYWLYLNIDIGVIPASQYQYFSRQGCECLFFKTHFNINIGIVKKNIAIGHLKPNIDIGMLLVLSKKLNINIELLQVCQYQYFFRKGLECLFFKTHLNIDIDIAKMKRPFLKSDLNIDIEYSKKKVHISISILVWLSKNPILILACFFFWAKTQYQYWAVALLDQYWYWEFDKPQVALSYIL